MYHTKYQTACDLYAIYQREYVFKTLKSNIVSGPIAKYDQRIIARNKVLEHKLMSAMATPPNLFDISRYRQPPGRFEKKVYSHPVNLYPDWEYFTRMMDRPFLNELHMWNTQPLYAWSESEEERQERMAYKERMAKYKRKDKRMAKYDKNNNDSMIDSCFIM